MCCYTYSLMISLVKLDDISVYLYLPLNNHNTPLPDFNRQFELKLKLFSIEFTYSNVVIDVLND